MRKLFTTCKSLILGGLMLSGLVASAQIAGTSGSYQFPQTIGYGVNGRIPTISQSVQITNAQQSYEYWKNNFVTSGCGGNEKRVIFDHFPGTTRGTEDKLTTVSEGIAYGMLLSAYAGDKTLFDGLWAYYQRFANGNGVMNFKIYNCNVASGGANGATDAELDAAMGLIVASYQWPGQGSYAGDASDLIRIIREKEFAANAVQKPGDQFGGTTSDNITNPSYFSPAYYEVYKDFDPGQDTFWDDAISKGYDIIEAAQQLSTNGNNNIGLVPDWTTITGGYSARAAQLNYEDDGENFIFDAIRTPFRTGMDALWTGNPRAKTYCNNLIDWAYDKYGGTTVGMGSKFNMNGDQLNNFHSNTFVGSFAVAAMGTDATGFGSEHTANEYQSYLDAAYNDNEQTEPGFGQYFNASFKVMTQFVMLGNFYKPPGGTCATPDLNSGDDVASLCNGGSVTLSTSNVSGTTYQWLKDGQSISGNSSSITVSSTGIYNVIATDGNCSRTDQITVGSGTINADFVAQSGGGSVNIQNTSSGGISSYSWTLKADEGAGATVATSTDEVPTNFTGLSAGVYEVELTVSNAGFSGCSATHVKTLNIAIGNGVGLALDDFNDAFNDGLNVYHYGGGFETLPTKDGGGFTVPDNECSVVDFVVDGSAFETYSTAEFALLTPLDLSASPFISIKLSSTETVTLDIYMGALDPMGRLDGEGNVKTLLATPNRVTLQANVPQEFSFNYGDVTTGSVDGAVTALPDWSEAKTISIRPFEATPTYSGTISVDYIIFGDKSLSAPEFDTKLNTDGTISFNNYIPNYIIDDPALDACTPATGSCYGSVPNFLPIRTACDPTLTVDANSCLSTNVKWYDATNDVLVAEGFTVDLGPGEYTVALEGPGGINERPLIIEEANLVADFTYSRENFQVDFINQSTSNSTNAWDFGDPISTANTSASELTSHYFEGGADDYDVKLVVSNTACGTKDSITKTITIACDQDPSPIVVTNTVVTEGCDGDLISIEIEASDFTTNYEYFYGAEKIDSGATTLSTSFALDKTADLKVEAFNNCGNSEEEIIALTLKPSPNSAFTIKEEGQFALVFPAQLLPGNTYNWTATGALTASPLTNIDMEDYFEYATDGTKEICLEVVNDCGTAPEVCEDAIIIVTGLSAQDKNGELAVFPTAVEEALTIQLNGTANVKVTDLIGNIVSESTIADQGTVNVSTLTPGAYVLLIELDGETVTKRFIKE